MDRGGLKIKLDIPFLRVCKTNGLSAIIHLGIIVSFTEEHFQRYTASLPLNQDLKTLTHGRIHCLRTIVSGFKKLQWEEATPGECVDQISTETFDMFLYGINL